MEKDEQALALRVQRVEVVTEGSIAALYDDHSVAMQQQLRDHVLLVIKPLQQEIADTFDPLIKNAVKSHKDALAAKRRYMEPLDRLMAAIEMALVSSRKRELPLAEPSAIVSGLDVIPLPLSPESSSPEIIEGIAFADKWRFQIVDEALVPREFCSPDRGKIGKAVRKLGPRANIPGVDILEESKVKFQ